VPHRTGRKKPSIAGRLGALSRRAAWKDWGRAGTGPDTFSKPRGD